MQWDHIAHELKERLNFPHVLGALNGKQVRIEFPKDIGSIYHNYKGFFSIVLLAIVLKPPDSSSLIDSSSFSNSECLGEIVFYIFQWRKINYSLRLVLQCIDLAIGGKHTIGMPSVL